MSSSGGSYQGPIASSAGPAIPNLPVAGADSTIGDPFKYGRFQNFLPDIQAEGRNPSATGLRPDMFTYRGPDGSSGPGPGMAAASSGGDANLSGQIQGLRDQLAQLQASSQANNVTWPGGAQRVGNDPIDTWTNRS